jgi:hypothetical protein
MKLSLFLFAGLFTKSARGMPTGPPPDDDPDPDPTACIDGGCTDDVTLKHRLGNYTADSDFDYDAMPISIIAQNGVTVTFEIAHQWGNINLDNFFVEYMLPQGGHVCRNTENFLDETCLQITARCMKNNHVAVVTLTAVDPLIVSTVDSPADILPKGCCDAAVEGDLNGNAVKYVFELHCDPKACSVENSNCPSGQKFTSGFLPDTLLARGKKCLFSEQCVDCCCNTNGATNGNGAQTCNPDPNDNSNAGKKCCDYALYTSTFPYGEACRAGGIGGAEN